MDNFIIPAIRAGLSTIKVPLSMDARVTLHVATWEAILEGSVTTFLRRSDTIQTLIDQGIPCDVALVAIQRAIDEYRQLKAGKQLPEVVTDHPKKLAPIATKVAPSQTKTLIEKSNATRSFRSQCRSTLAYFFEAQALQDASRPKRKKTCTDMTQEHVLQQKRKKKETPRFIDGPSLGYNDRSVAAIVQRYLGGGDDGIPSIVLASNTRCSICHEFGHYESECHPIHPHQLIHFLQTQSQQSKTSSTQNVHEIDMEQCGAFFVESCSSLTKFARRTRSYIDEGTNVTENYHILESKDPKHFPSVSSHMLAPGDFVAWVDNPQKKKEQSINVGTIVELAENKAAHVQFLFHLGTGVESYVDSLSAPEHSTRKCNPSYNSLPLNTPESGSRLLIIPSDLYLINENIQFNVQQISFHKDQRTK